MARLNACSWIVIVALAMSLSHNALADKVTTNNTVTTTSTQAVQGSLTNVLSTSLPTGSLTPPPNTPFLPPLPGATGLLGAGRFALAPQKGEAAAGGIVRWNGWFSLAQNQIGNSFEPIKMSGRVNSLSGGIDYRFENNTTLGLAVVGSQVRAGLNGTAATGNFSADGTTFAPYIGIPLNQNWSLDGSVATSRNKVSTSVNGATGDFRLGLLIGTFGATYRQGFGKWLVSARGGFSSTGSETSSYTRSDGSFSDRSTSSTSQARLGGQVAYAAGYVTPYVGLTYIYDTRFIAGNAINGVTPANDRDAWQAQVGMMFRSSGSLYGMVQYSTDQNRKEIKNDQIMFNLGLRF